MSTARKSLVGTPGQRRMKQECSDGCQNKGELNMVKKIYDQLLIEARPVFALRCKFPAEVVDGMPSPEGVSGHAWLRVKIADEELDVCTGSVSNRPGVTHFEVLSKVRTWHPWLRPFTHLGSSIENIRRDMVARRGFTGAARSPIDTRGRVASLCSTCLTRSRKRGLAAVPAGGDAS